VAEEILFHNIPKELIVIEFVNSSKRYFRLWKQRKTWIFQVFKILTNPEVGETLQVRFDGEGKDIISKYLRQKKLTQIWNQIQSGFDGFLIINLLIPLALLMIFMLEQLIQEHSLNNGDLVKGRAILSFNKERNEWGWKAVEICKQTCD